MNQKYLKVILLTVCVMLLFAGCRARIIGNRNAADEIIQDASITLPTIVQVTTPQTETEENTEKNNEKTNIKQNSTNGLGGSEGGGFGRQTEAPVTQTSTTAVTTKKTKTATTAQAPTATKPAEEPSSEPVSEAVYYEVSFDKNGGWGKAKSRKVAFGHTYGEGFPKIYNTKGYTFDGWYDAKEGGSKVSNTDIFSRQEDIVLYAHWSYDPAVFWYGYLRGANVYACQIQNIYIEFDNDNETVNSSVVISNTRSNNAAEKAEVLNLTDTQIKQLGCDIIVKVVSDYENAQAHYHNMKARFSYKPVYIIPRAAEYGSAEETTYYALLLSKEIYAKAFTDFDAEKCAEELGVSGTIYTED